MRTITRYITVPVAALAVAATPIAVSAQGNSGNTPAAERRQNESAPRGRPNRGPNNLPPGAMVAMAAAAAAAAAGLAAAFGAFDRGRPVSGPGRRP